MPRRDEPRTTIRWTAEERDHLKRLAAQAGVKVGRLVRETTLRYGAEYAASVSAAAATVPAAGAASSRAAAESSVNRPAGGSAPAVDASAGEEQ